MNMQRWKRAPTSAHVCVWYVCVNQRHDVITAVHVLYGAASGEKDKDVCVFQAKAPGQITCDQPSRKE